MFWIEFITLMLIIVWGTRKGGTFLAMAGGVGMLVFTFIFREAPADPPTTVILIMLAVITAACTMQTTGGLDFMVKLAEKILRRHPRSVTILAPIVSYVFTFCTGTGHIIYSLLPVINEISIGNKIRPERPISASIVASQQAITASPITAATVALIGYMSTFQNVNLGTVMLVCLPATLFGSIAAGLSVYRRGAELEDDPEYQRRLAAGLIEPPAAVVAQEKTDNKMAKISVFIFLGAMVLITICGIFPQLLPTFDDTKLNMTVVISTNMSALTNKYPWVFILAVFIVGAITTSQASTTMIMVPIAIALNLPAYIIVAGWVACSSNYFIPDASQSVAGLAFDTAGTTKIGKFILNHSYMRPGLVCTVVSVIVTAAIGYFVF